MRKAHNSGRNHLSNVRDYYACKSCGLTIEQKLTNTALGHDKAQNIIDQITSAFEKGGGPPPGGFSFQFSGPPGGFSGPPGFGPPPGFQPPFPGMPGMPFMPPPPGLLPPGALPPGVMRK